ncbi:MAG: hypothetical protein ACLRXP_02805 [Oscillospiraceae bacterium]
MDKEIYNSIFQEEIHDLIALKHALGFSYESEAGSLRRIDTFYVKTIFPKSVSLKSFVTYGAEKGLMKLSQIRRAVSVSCGFSADISTISGFLHIFRRKGSPGKGADTMHIFTQMKNFKVFLMQLTKVSRCRIPARIVLM